LNLVLREPTLRKIVSKNNSQIKTSIQDLVMTAAENRLYSLSSPQIKYPISMFCMYKDLSDYKWKADSDKKLNTKEYEIVINPEIVSETKIFHNEYEHCSSFNS
jgi:peptide deformylase